jgi:hypothetical protein
LFTAEAQRTPREGFFCLSGDDDKQKDSSEREEGRKAFFLEESGLQKRLQQGCEELFVIKPVAWPSR